MELICFVPLGIIKEEVANELRTVSVGMKFWKLSWTKKRLRFCKWLRMPSLASSRSCWWKLTRINKLNRSTLQFGGENGLKSCSISRNWLITRRAARNRSSSSLLSFKILIRALVVLGRAISLLQYKANKVVYCSSGSESQSAIWSSFDKASAVCCKKMMRNKQDDV